MAFVKVEQALIPHFSELQRQPAALYAEIIRKLLAGERNVEFIAAPALRLAGKIGHAVFWGLSAALEPVAAGIRVAVEGASVTTREDIPQGHKLALTAIPAGADVIKYGYPIGRARTEIQPGQWVHTHNLATRLDGAGAPQAQVRGGAPAPLRPRSFQGYRRADGRVGIRNELWIVPTVGCVNGVARSMARRVEDYARGRVDGVHVWFHPYGCSQMGEDQEHTRAILCGLIRHPNAGAVLVLGLGCENSSIAVLQERLGRWDSQRVAFLECQAVEDELAEGERLLRELADVPEEQRGAKFVSAVCFMLPDGRALEVEGECPGRIAFKRGCGSCRKICPRA